MIDGDELIRQIDLNRFALYRSLADACGGRYETLGDYSFVDSTREVWGHAVFGLNLKDKEALSSLVARIKSGELPNMVNIGPTSKPADLEPLLAAQGMRALPHSTGMILRQADFVSAPQPGPGFSVTLPDIDPELSDWGGLIAEQLFHKPGPLHAADFAALMQPLIESGSLIGYLGYQDGIPVATAALFIHHGVGGLYFVTTHPDYRKRGFGAALSSMAVEEAFRLGCSALILHASELGQSVYARIGFKPVCPLARYSLPAGE